MTGVIKTLAVDKETGASRGFGFIKGEDNKEYFFHRSAVQDTAWEDLIQNDRVSFDIEPSDRGPRATHVTVL